jgi:ABC-type nickel/cobalt efflux system permease component RcnA
MLIASDEKKKLRQAPVLGALWGLGHTASLFAAGLIVLILAINIPEKVSNTLEFGVGVMLVYLAITTLTGFNIGKFVKGLLHHDKTHSHPHSHKEYDVIHTHEHNHYHYEKEHQHGHKALLVGMIHGMAGSGALMLVVLSTIGSIPLGLAYITIFGAGSILSMMALSTIIGLPFAKAKRSAKLNFVLKYVAGVTTLMIGGWLMYELGVVEEIFL